MTTPTTSPEVDQRVGERPGVDDQGLPGVVEGEGGVLVLGDSHAPSQAAADGVGKRLTSGVAAYGKARSASGHEQYMTRCVVYCTKRGVDCAASV